MFNFKGQIQTELERIEVIRKRAVNYDRELLNEVFDGRALLNGEVSIYSDKSRFVNGVRERSRMLVGLSTDPFVREVAEAKYLDRLMKNIEADKALLGRMLRDYRPYGRDDIIGQLPSVYGKTIIGDRPVRIVRGEQGKEWAESQIWHNPREFTTRHLTVTGVPVRSKNEAIIYNMYWHYSVPVRFEDRLVLLDESGRKVEVYPDFSILAADGRVLAHEHAGMLDKPVYRESFVNKIGLYLANGYTLMDTLFITADGPNGSIDTEAIDKMIRTFILPRI